MTRAAVLHEAGAPLELHDIDLAPTGPGQVRVRLRATGVCHSDLSLARGRLPHPLPVVLGHEAAGEVVEVGDGVTKVAPGDRVILAWSPPCRSCFFCDRGEPHLCEQTGARTFAAPYATLGGEKLWSAIGTAAFAEETLVLAESCVPFGDDVSFEVAALVGCAVMTGVGAVVNTARVPAGASVTVIGCGGVGLSVVQGARVAGAARVVAVDPLAERRELALALGATDVVDGAADVEAQVRGLTAGRGTDYAFEVIGRPETIKLAYRLTRRGGTTVVVGAGPHDVEVGFSPLELFYQARSLVGCVYGSCDPDRDFPAMLDLYRSGALDLDRLVTATLPLSEVNEALARLERGDGARTVLVP
jgi:S-(hydroxymethyl)glutathione dehydrogenase / alcohol dehydrogenase